MEFAYPFDRRMVKGSQA